LAREPQGAKVHPGWEGCLWPALWEPQLSREARTLQLPPRQQQPSIWACLHNSHLGRVSFHLPQTYPHKVPLACWELQVYFRHPRVDHLECLPLQLPQGQERTLLDSQGCLGLRELQGLEPHHLGCHQACHRPSVSLPQGLLDPHPGWAAHPLYWELGLLASTALPHNSRELELLLPTPLAPLQP